MSEDTTKPTEKKRKPRKASAFRVLPIAALEQSIGAPSNVKGGRTIIDQGTTPDGDYVTVCIRNARRKGTVTIAKSKPLKL